LIFHFYWNNAARGTAMTQHQEIRQEHPYFMYDAIMRQPEAIQETLRRHAVEIQELAATIVRKRRIYLVGIGTSWHAAVVAQHWFRRFSAGQMEVQAWHSFEFCAYSPLLSQDDVVIVISHRGTKTYSFLALELARSNGPFTIAITANDSGPRIQGADSVLHTVEQERSAAFTVSYTTALTMLALLAISLGNLTDSSEDVPYLRAQLEQVPQVISQVLTQQRSIQQAVRRFQYRQRFICAGWGPNIASAYEVALKLKETSATDSEGIQVEQLLHGPFCSVDHRCLITLIAPPGPGYERTMDISRAAAAVDAPVWALVQEGDSLLSNLVTETFTVPNMPEFWSPLAYIVPLQLFTYYLAVARGSNPDLFQQNNPKQAAARRHYDL
jgi:glucosamine--fructose-6-phosphate aminotransferase (isomerizing)